MARQSNNRLKLIEAAQFLFHKHGIEGSTLADVAQASGVPLGNIYYYFKTKEELILAVAHSQKQSMREFLDKLDGLSSPRQRLLRFIQSFDQQRTERAAHGCPWGTLCQEANRLGETIAKHMAAPFDSIITWMRSQFRELGYSPSRSKQYAFHILSVIQGASLAAHTFGDPKVMRDEMNHLSTWLRSLFESSTQPVTRNGKGSRHQLSTLPV